MSRPSASVFNISIVIPDMLLMTSPGLVALPDGIFSTAGIRPTTLISNAASERADMTPSTDAPPHISNFISSIPLPGLRLIPPVSKVTALPTRTIGCCMVFDPLYSITINLLGCAEAFPTDNKDNIPRSFISDSPKIVVLMHVFSSDNDFAFSARKVGVQILAGVFPKCLQRFIPRPTASPYFVHVSVFDNE